MAIHKSNKRRNYFGRNYLIDVLVTVILLCLFFLVINIVAPSKEYGVLPSFKIIAVEPEVQPRSLDVPILLYHYVENVRDAKDTIRKSLNITPYIFENQVATLMIGNYTFLTPGTISAILEGKRSLPRRPIVLSFDDGYEDFYTDVFPVLKKYHVRAVAYIISGFLDKPNYMSKRQLRAVIKSGLVEIGCHTAHHPDLANTDLSLSKQEIWECERDIARDFGIKPVSFAYPYGSYTPKLFEILKEAGLKNAVTTKPGINIYADDTYEIPRIRPGGRVGQELLTYILTQNTTARAGSTNP